MSYKQLTENERYQIYILNKAGHIQEYIAQMLKRNPSTISRELRRNHGLKGYRPKQAQHMSNQRRQNAHKARKMTTEVAGWIEMLIGQNSAHNRSWII